MGRMPRWVGGVVLGAWALGCAMGTGGPADAPRMTVQTLHSMLGDPQLVILDLRSDEDWKKATLKIKGAARENPRQPAKSWAEGYPKEKTIVLYCA